MPACEQSALSWRKSSYSDAKDECVEIARTAGSALVRDSKNPGGGSLRFTPSTWHTLIEHLDR